MFTRPCVHVLVGELQHQRRLGAVRAPSAPSNRPQVISQTEAVIAAQHGPPGNETSTHAASAGRCQRPI